MIQTAHEPLSAFEKAALALGQFTNERPAMKRLQFAFVQAVSRTWVRNVVARRTYVDGVDWLKDLDHSGGLLLASNHRSFFDQYIATFALYESGVNWPQRLYFPVRAKFFYDHPTGVLINMLIGGGAMYPPIYREAGRAALNRDALAKLIQFLSVPGSLVGMHPEGRRNKGADPYEMLRAQPGVGEVILRARPLVVPLFIGGLTNDFIGQAKLNYHRDARRIQPLILCFGKPVEYEEYTQQPPRRTLYKRVADKVRQAILELGERERVLRSMSEAGTLPDDDPGWLLNRRRSPR